MYSRYLIPIFLSEIFSVVTYCDIIFIYTKLWELCIAITQRRKPFILLHVETLWKRIFSLKDWFPRSSLSLLFHICTVWPLLLSFLTLLPSTLLADHITIMAHYEPQILVKWHTFYFCRKLFSKHIKLYWRKWLGLLINNFSILYSIAILCRSNCFWSILLATQKQGIFHSTNCYAMNMHVHGE